MKKLVCSGCKKLVRRNMVVDIRAHGFTTHWCPLCFEEVKENCLLDEGAPDWYIIYPRDGRGNCK